MTKEVLLTISCLHYEANPVEEMKEQDEPIEVITPATYYLKNGKHYVAYEEVVEGIPGITKNMIRLSEEGHLETSKTGLTNNRMVFEKDRINMTQYETPYGELMVGVYTKQMQIDVAEEDIDVTVNYALDINGEKVADCDIRMNIHAKGSVEN